MRTFIIIAIVAFILGLGIGVKVMGWKHDAELKAAVSAALKKAQGGILVQHDAGKVTQEVGQKTETKQAEIRWRTQFITKEVIRYVTPETDKRYPLPWGFVRLHDSAALGVEPGAVSSSAGKLDGDAADVTASAAATTIALNYGEYYQCRQEVIGWNEWYKRTEELWNKTHGVH